MNLRPPGYEPDELPAALLRDIELDPVGAGDRTRTGTVLLPGDFKSPVSTIPPHRRISAGIIVPHTGGKVKGFSKIYFKGRGICNWTAHGGCCKKGRTKVRRNMVRCSFFFLFTTTRYSGGACVFASNPVKYRMKTNWPHTSQRTAARPII